MRRGPERAWQACLIHALAPLTFVIGIALLALLELIGGLVRGIDYAGIPDVNGFVRRMLPNGSDLLNASAELYLIVAVLLAHGALLDAALSQRPQRSSWRSGLSRAPVPVLLVVVVGLGITAITGNDESAGRVVSTETTFVVEHLERPGESAEALLRESEPGDDGEPKLVVPATREVGYEHRTVRKPAGVVVITGGSDGTPRHRHVSRVEPGELPGPVYPRDVARDQRDGTQWFGGADLRAAGFGYRATRIGEVLVQAVDGTWWWYAPLARRRARQLVATTVCLPVEDLRLELSELLPSGREVWQAYVEVAGQGAFWVDVPVATRSPARIVRADPGVSAAPPPTCAGAGLLSPRWRDCLDQLARRQGVIWLAA